MENKERKNGEVDQRNSKKTWLEAKILGARSLTEEHKQPIDFWWTISQKHQKIPRAA